MSRIRANTITNKAATGAPTFSNGAVVTGVCTATSFKNADGSAVGGKILQVVQGTKVDTFNTTSASDVEVTGLNVAITPIAASSKVLLNIHLGSVGGQTNCYAGFTLYRINPDSSSSDLLIGTGGTSNRPNVTFSVNTNAQSDYHTNPASFQFLDTPTYSVGQTITYKVKVRSGYNNKNIWVNRQHNQDDQNYSFHTASTYIAQEIGA